MATTQKKTTAKKKAAPSKKRAAELKKMEVRREISGAVLIVVAIICGMSWLPVDGFLLTWLDTIGSSIIGAGFYLLPFCLLGAGMLLIIKKRGRARLRVACILIMPVLFGAMMHLFRCKDVFEFTSDSIKALASSGITHASGGLLAGPIAIALRAALSDVGAIIIICALSIICIMVAFNTSVSGMVSSFKKLPPEEQEPPRSLPTPAPNAQSRGQVAFRQPVLASLFSRKKNIDISLEDTTDKKPPKGPPIELAPPNVLTPDQVMGRDMQKQKPAYTIADPIKSAENISPVLPSDTPSSAPFIAPAVMRAMEMAAANAAASSALIDTEPAHIEPEHIEHEHFEPCDIPAIDYETSSGTLASDFADYMGMHSPDEEIGTGEALVNSVRNSSNEQDDPWADYISNANAGEKDSAASEIAQNVSKQMGGAQIPTKKPDTYMYPPMCLLTKSTAANGDFATELTENSARLIDTLKSFGIEANLIDITRGPSVTRYEVQLGRGTKFSRITNLSEDIALSLGTASVRIATIPDKLAIGIEVPNTSVQLVTIRDIVDTNEFRASKSRISFAVGKDITGRTIVGDIKKMPHMLIAGTTGSGKSVCINSLLISLIYKSTPQEVRLIMVDPKMIELGVYNGIPHLLIPVVTDPRKASGALNWAVSEMMRRYKLFSECNVRDLEAYNNEMEKQEGCEKLPQIVIVIDELADLMFVAAGEVENAIVRIAQMARAAGMHLIIATQRPSADVITGIMKANIPSRISFAVASQIESRIILDSTGAEKLLGRGDMLYNPLGAPKPLRVQGCFITTSEIEEVVEFIKKTGKPDYSEEVMQHIEKQAEAPDKDGGASGASGDGDDDMINRAIETVIETGQASVSQLQRRLKLGYSRAARLMDEMEERGVVGPFEGSKPRQIMISREDWQQMALRQKD